MPSPFGAAQRIRSPEDGNAQPSQSCFFRLSVQLPDAIAHRVGQVTHEEITIVLHAHPTQRQLAGRPQRRQVVVNSPQGDADAAQQILGVGQVRLRTRWRRLLQGPNVYRESSATRVDAHHGECSRRQLGQLLGHWLGQVPLDGSLERPRP
jgi:hypothetical protein